MRVPYAWLRELAPTKLTPDKLAQALTMSGTEVTAVERVNGDTVLELEVTPNRADCLSMIGVAREVAAVTGGTLRVAPLSCETVAEKKARERARLAIRIDDHAGCPRYIGRLITGVTVSPSPRWMQRRLLACGVRPINNVVDITNYVLLETGQPLHAFDWSTMHRETIVIRRARTGECLRAIDAGQHALDSTMLVVADADRAVAVAGIMGGAETAMTPSTCQVLLESAWFNQRSIRHTARALGLHSESSYRFERGIDPAGVAAASQRAARLIMQHAGGQVIACADVGSRALPKRRIVVVPEDINHALGLTVPAPRMKRMFQSLGCQVSGSKHRWRLDVPTHRPDLTQPADCVEEVARLYGYERIPSKPLRVPLAQATPLHDDARTVRQRVRTTLIRAGLQEAVTWSLVSESLITLSGRQPATAIRVTNPLSQEQAYLRPVIWPRLVEAIAANVRRQAPGVALFEVGQVYARQDNGQLRAAWHLALACTGHRLRDWTGEAIAWDYFALKGVLETLSCTLRLMQTTWAARATPALEPTQSAVWRVGDEEAGILGAVHGDVLARVDVKQPIYVAECQLAPLMAQAALTWSYTPIARVPAVHRDLSFVLSREHTHAAIAQIIREAAGLHLTQIRLMDLYSRPPIPPQSISLTYRLMFQHPTKTLTDAEVHHAQQAVIRAVTSTCNATVRT